MAHRPLWKRIAHPAARHAERALDAARRRFVPRSRELHIHPYIGHGTSEEIVLRGRVLQDPPLDVSVPDGGLWRRALDTFDRFESDEVPGVEVTVEVDGERLTVTTDEEGYYEARLPAAGGDGPWRRGTASTAGCEVPVEAIVPDAVPDSVLVISDIDDTVLETGAQRFVQMARATIFGTFRTRTPVPAMGRFYQGLVRGSAGDRANPVFYVSSSPWNLYDILLAFLDFRGLPRGPLFLRDLGIDESTFISSGHETHKRAAIDEILDTHQGHRAILVGDTGQHDPEIYAAVAREQPGRIAAIYLRDVAGARRDAEVDAIAAALSAEGVPVVRALDAEAFADHALAVDLISQEDRAAVRRELGVPV